MGIKTTDAISEVGRKKTSEMLSTCKYHGLVDTDMGAILMSTDVWIDPVILVEAADVFRLKVNELYRARRF